MCPGQSVSLYAPEGDRVSRGTSFLAPGFLARRRLARVIHHHQRPRRLLWATSNTNKPQTPLGFGLLRSRAVCWLLKQARAVVDEDEEAASSNRAIYEARHTPSAAAAARTVRGDCSQPGSDSAAQRRSRAIRLAVRLVRESAPKGARMFTSNDVTSKCEAQSSQLAPSLVDRHLQRASRGAPTSRTSSNTINGGTQFQTR